MIPRPFCFDLNYFFRCTDDQAVFELRNKAIVHFWFAGDDRNKSIEHAFQEFGTSVADYDVIIANAGNKPPMETEHVVSSAQHFYRANVSFLWLTTYDGEGDIRNWTDEDQQAFVAANGKHVPVHRMIKSVTNFTRGFVEGTNDEHFCLPGPPNELGRVVLQLIWALQNEVQESNSRS